MIKREWPDMLGRYREEYDALKQEIRKTIDNVRSGAGTRHQCRDQINGLRAYASVIRTELERERFHLELERYERGVRPPGSDATAPKRAEA